MLLLGFRQALSPGYGMVAVQTADTAHKSDLPLTVVAVISAVSVGCGSLEVLQAAVPGAVPHALSMYLLCIVTVVHGMLAARCWPWRSCLCGHRHCCMFIVTQLICAAAMWLLQLFAKCKVAAAAVVHSALKLC